MLMHLKALSGIDNIVQVLVPKMKSNNFAGYVNPVHALYQEIFSAQS